eukprot:GHVR01149253.1.p1 GENE.GHVR01149253.1~~GHVR01149253.1.p1  ORF type:complete len:374 (+),score=126.96 GHVR01149253.1:430-1551(+)
MTQAKHPLRLLANKVEGVKFTTKTGITELVNTIHPDNSQSGAHCSWFPLTFRLPMNLQVWHAYRQQHPNIVWIFKPRAANCGRGIFLVSQASDVDDKAAHMGGGVVQVYVDRPLLIYGRKFDLRMYLLIARVCPLLAYYRDGYVRRCIRPYDPNDRSEKGLFGHLTNNAVQKKTTEYKQHKEESVWLMSRFQKYMTEEGIAPHDWVDNNLRPRVLQICTEIITASNKDISPIHGSFELFGFDVLIDENLQIYLLEINSNPAIHTNTIGLKLTIPAVLNEAFDLVFYAHKRTFALNDQNKDYVAEAAIHCQQYYNNNNNINNNNTSAHTHTHTHTCNSDDDSKFPTFSVKKTLMVHPANTHTHTHTHNKYTPPR